MQTPTMATALRDWYGSAAPQIDILPFATSQTVGGNGKTNSQSGCEKDIEFAAGLPHTLEFLYVSDGSIHKNHKRLFGAWQILAEQGYFPSLALTLHPKYDSELCAEVNRIVADHGVRIQNLGYLPHEKIIQLYKTAKALIFASYAESFGLPLIEAQSLKLPILAPELDYVRDICEPTVTFDPHSSRSIARAIKRFLGLEADMLSLLDAQAFVDALHPRIADGSS